jgi:hypothetical protein
MSRGHRSVVPHRGPAVARLANELMVRLDIVIDNDAVLWLTLKPNQRVHIR